MKLYPINELHTSGCFKTPYLKPVFATGVGLIIKSNVKFKPYTENLEHSSNMDDDTTSTCTSRVHCWTDVAWWDQVRGCSKMLPYCPIPFIFLSDAPLPPPPLLGLSSELHVARLPTASCDKPSCPLTTSFLMLAGETRVVAASVCVRACARAPKHAQTRAHAHTLGSREHHPRRRRVSKWPNTGCLMSVCFASSLLSLCLRLRSPSLYVCLSFIPCLSSSLYWYLYFCLSWLLLFPLLKKHFYVFFPPLLFSFSSCFTFFKCYSLCLSVFSFCLSLSLCPSLQYFLFLSFFLFVLCRSCFSLSSLVPFNHSVQDLNVGHPQPVLMPISSNIDILSQAFASYHLTSKMEMDTP